MSNINNNDNTDNSNSSGSKLDFDEDNNIVADFCRHSFSRKSGLGPKIYSWVQTNKSPTLSKPQGKKIIRRTSAARTKITLREVSDEKKQQMLPTQEHLVCLFRLRINSLVMKIIKLYLAAFTVRFAILRNYASKRKFFWFSENGVNLHRVRILSRK